MKIKLLIIFLLVFNLAYSQVKDTLSVSALELTKQEVTYDPSNFTIEYPNNWGLNRLDKNIDHRRVPNLMTLFERKGTVKPITQKPEDYSPGDIVCWKLSSGVPHIGIVVHKKSDDKLRYLIVHNIGAGQVLEDCLFDFKIIGHYRYKN